MFWGDAKATRFGIRACVISHGLSSGPPHQPSLLYRPSRYSKSQHVSLCFHGDCRLLLACSYDNHYIETVT